MKNLVYKELTLSIHKFFYVLPFIISLLFFIPQWFFTLVVMYFFWITVSNVYSTYNAQLDYHFINLLPVTKKEVVLSKTYTFIIIELLHIVLAVIFGIVHNLIYGMANFGMDINPAFYGIIFITFGLFNIIFLPLYFKTAYKFGLPLILGVVATLVFGGFFELSALVIPSVRNVMENGDQLIQMGILVFGVGIFVILNIVGIKHSVHNYKQIKR